jgi:hypothetical protein
MNRKELRLASKIDAALAELDALGFKHNVAGSTLAGLAQSFNASTLPLTIALCDIILDEKPLTVRRCLYRASVQGLVAGTDDDSYNRVQYLVLRLRRKDFIPYGWISDSSRRRLKPSSWSGLADYAETVNECYRKNLWASQPWHIEVFTEKDAMTGVLHPTTSKFDLHLNVIRGQVSETFVWEIAEQWRQIKKPILALYFGDHDPSGLNIEASLKNRLRKFLPQVWDAVTWTRLAINAKDFADQSLLGLSVKKDDKQGKKYIERFGNRCVEVDALSANVIRERLDDVILAHIDAGAWERLQEHEEAERQTMQNIFWPVMNGGCRYE